MNADDMDHVVARIIGARRAVTTLEALPADLRPATMEAAYAIQDRVVTRLLQGEGATRIGFKVGATNDTARATLGFDQPFTGVLMSSRHVSSPATFKARDFQILVIEPEFAVRLSKDLPARSAPYDAAAVAEAVDAVMPAIELVSPTFREWTKVGGMSLTADNAAHGTWITGAPVTGWRAHDMAKTTVTLSVNGAVKETGGGANVDGGPLNVLAWLANALLARGSSLKAGDMVTTGTTTPVYPAKRGDQVTADFGPFGKVSVSFS